MTTASALNTTRREYLTTAELAEELHLHPITLVKWRREGRGPAFVRFGRAIRYPRAQLVAFEASNLSVLAAA